MSNQITIERPVAEVEAYLLDPSNDPNWMKALTEARALSEGPVGPGYRVVRVARFLGRRMEYTLEIADYQPGHRLVMKSVGGPFPMNVTYSLEPVEGGTRVTIRNQGSAAGFFKLAEGALAGMVRKNVDQDLRNLKAVLER